MAVLAWLLKRVLPGAGGQQSVVRIVGGVSVGSRERVVVVEVADRWLVVGVAPGQINAIANLDIGTVKFSEQMTEISPSVNNQLSPALNALTQPFSQWLKKSSGKFTEKKDV
jgi:flagellar protein FliO/FliZ